MGQYPAAEYDSHSWGEGQEKEGGGAREERGGARERVKKKVTN